MVKQEQPCSLDPATQKLISNIFSKEMFKNTMTLMDLGEGKSGRVAVPRVAGVRG